MSGNRYVVIMAGGRGERFWPKSRLRRPKHLLPIVGDKPMLTQTVERLGTIVPPERVLIITNREQRDAVLEVCPMVPGGNVISEPVGRDTAAAVGLATLIVKSRCADGCFAMLPADAVIHDVEGLQSVLESAFTAAEQEDALVTIGIKAAYPATGYGYIHRGDAVGEASGRAVYSVKEFKEKPDLMTARSYVESGQYYWNAGMFFWRVSVIAREFEQHTPMLWQALGAIDGGLQTGESLDVLLERFYPSLEKISVDFAIMEKAQTVRVVESAFDWDDVGEWPAVARHAEKDDDENVSRGSVVLHGCKGNIVIGDEQHTLAIIGVEDLIVVRTEDATLICPKSKAQEIKGVVKSLAADPAYQHLL